ncbi:Uncharacterised protein [Vibrio cincinnatiensis]|uniref:Uncharacterized protein n=1 Tax=Vibrio cincinnatiensis DSM 19608 TaxID=1123491 RepID=A0A1T4S9S3_VIBCI|nr:hypothetical protein SAMN02745782_03099 [Vibrio cincinnatiensis DSM 19608]SUP49871.1 Uncharacterised protein [Vibrio cincinnatiensis]
MLVRSHSAYLAFSQFFLLSHSVLLSVIGVDKVWTMAEIVSHIRYLGDMNLGYSTFFMSKPL